MTISHVLVPSSVVRAAADFCEYAGSTGLSLLKVALVNVSVGIDHDAKALLAVFFPISLVFGAIGAEPDAVAVSFVLCVPLAVVRGAVGQAEAGLPRQSYVSDVLEAVTLPVGADAAKVHASRFIS